MVVAIAGSEKYIFSGDWNVYYRQDENFGYWNITGVQIKGIKF